MWIKETIYVPNRLINLKERGVCVLKNEVLKRDKKDKSKFLLQKKIAYVRSTEQSKYSGWLFG